MCAWSGVELSCHGLWTVSPPRPHTLNSTSMSKAYQSTFTGETNTPYSKQFVHSKSSQYRRLRTEWKNNVYLARSRIQGLGLYAAKDLEKHTMVIEYIGTIIRNEVANRREKIYEEQVWAGRGAIMVHLAKGQGQYWGQRSRWKAAVGRGGERQEKRRVRNEDELTAQAHHLTPPPPLLPFSDILAPSATSAFLESRHLHVSNKQRTCH